MATSKRRRCEYLKCPLPALEGSTLGLCQEHTENTRKLSPGTYRRGLRVGTEDVDRYADICKKLSETTRTITQEDYRQAKRDIASLTPRERESASQVLHRAHFPHRFRRTAYNGSWLTYRAGMVNIVLRGNYRIVG